MSTRSVRGTTAPNTDPTPQPGPPRLDELEAHGAAFDAGVEEIRKWWGSDLVFLFARLEDRLARRLGLAPRTAGSAVLAGLTGIGVRLSAALVATALVGEWADIPWARWVAILVYWGLFDATQPWRTPPLDVPMRPSMKRAVEAMTPLIPTIAHESDLRDLTDFVKRWLRLPVAAAVGVSIATLLLAAGWLFTPAGMSELHAGTVVLLAFVLYDFGALMVFGGIVEWMVATRQATYDHHLFWASPADSPEVRKAMQVWNPLALAFWITVHLVLAVFLVSWSSPVVMPLAVGFIAIGYLVTLGVAFGVRASTRKIIEGSRQRRLAVLRDRIDAFEPRFADLSQEESERLNALLSLHNTIRDAPATFSATHTAARAAARLIVPTIVFIITVFGEVSAERFLDAILP